MPNKHKLTQPPNSTYETKTLKALKLDQNFYIWLPEICITYSFNATQVSKFLPAFETHTLRKTCQYIKKQHLFLVAPLDKIVILILPILSLTDTL